MKSKETNRSIKAERDRYQKALARIVSGLCLTDCNGMGPDGCDCDQRIAEKALDKSSVKSSEGK